MELFFCDQCGKRVSDVDLEEGRASRTDDGIVCIECAPAQKQPSGPQGVQRSSGSARRVEASRRSGSRPAGSARATRQVDRGAPAKSKGPGTAVVLFLVAVVGGVLAAVLFSGGSQNPPQKRSSNRSVKPKTVKKPTIEKRPTKKMEPNKPDKAAEPLKSAAELAMEAARQFEKDNPKDVKGALPLYQKIISEFKGTPQASDAEFRVMALQAIVRRAENPQPTPKPKPEPVVVEAPQVDPEDTGGSGELIFDGTSLAKWKVASGPGSVKIQKGAMAILGQKEIIHRGERKWTHAEISFDLFCKKPKNGGAPFFIVVNPAGSTTSKDWYIQTYVHGDMDIHGIWQIGTDQHKVDRKRAGSGSLTLEKWAKVHILIRGPYGDVSIDGKKILNFKMPEETPIRPGYLMFRTHYSNRAVYIKNVRLQIRK